MALVSTAAKGAGGATELAYTEFTANVTVSNTSEGTAQDIVSSGALTFTGVPIIVQFFCPVIEPVSATGGNLFVLLQDGATVLGRIGLFSQGGNLQSDQTTFAERKLTPSAGSHTYKITAYRALVNWTVGAGTAGSGNFVPGFIRILTV